jgi:hypothetical protein
MKVGAPVRGLRPFEQLRTHGALLIAANAVTGM